MSRVVSSLHRNLETQLTIGLLRHVRSIQPSSPYFIVAGLCRVFILQMPLVARIPLTDAESSRHVRREKLSLLVQMITPSTVTIKSKNRILSRLRGIRVIWKSFSRRRRNRQTCSKSSQQPQTTEQWNLSKFNSKIFRNCQTTLLFVKNLKITQRIVRQWFCNRS